VQRADNLTTFMPIVLKYITFEKFFYTVYLVCFILLLWKNIILLASLLPWDYSVHVTTLAAAKTVAGPLIHGRGYFFKRHSVSIRHMQ
jgi:hypothetical protein